MNKETTDGETSSAPRDPFQGLSSEEARALQQKYGPNRIEAKEKTWWQRLLARFWGPIPWMIEIAAILSASVKRWEDFVIIMVMLLKRVFDLVKDFGTSESPKSTRSSTTHWCPGRPGHPAFRHNIASSLRLHTGLPYDWTPRSDAPLGSPLAPSARRVSRVASRLPGTTRLRFALHGGQRQNADVPEEELEKQAREVAKLVRKELNNMPLPEGTVRRHESEIIAHIEKANGFAQVYPEDKYFIVDELQKADRIVGMTGDGVNDAPALKKADAGIAVSGATDAARAAAEIVLTAPGLGVILDAIKQARITFERMQSYTIFRIAETIRIIFFMGLAIGVFQFYPVTALMIIVLALLNDIPILAIAYDNTRIRNRPIRWDMQASLRSRERFWDIRVPKIDSIFDNSLVPRPSWSPGVPPQHRKLVAATHRSPI